MTAPRLIAATSAYRTLTCPGEPWSFRAIRPSAALGWTLAWPTSCFADFALIYLPAREAEFIGRAELATAVHDWAPSEAEAYPGDSPSGVLLSQVEEWDTAVPMEAVVQRIGSDGIEPARPGERRGRLPNGRRSDYR
jgi:hypothetical protein